MHVRNHYGQFHDSKILAIYLDPSIRIISRSRVVCWRFFLCRLYMLNQVVVMAGDGVNIGPSLAVRLLGQLVEMSFCKIKHRCREIHEGARDRLRDNFETTL